MMRLRVHLHAEDGQIPWIDRLRPGRGLLYHWLERINPDLSRVVHDSRRIAPFGYGRLTFPDARRRPETYPVGGEGWWDIGTIHPRVAQAWTRVLADRPIISWAGTQLAVTATEQTRPPTDLATGSAVLTTTTPVVIRDRSRPLMPADPGYTPALVAAVRARVGAVCARPNDVWVRVLWSGEPEMVPISVTRHGDGLPPLSGCPVKVHVCGPPAALEALWCCGIGALSTAGFGWVQHPDGQRVAEDRPALDRDTAVSLCATVHPTRTAAWQAAAMLRGHGWAVQTAIRPRPEPDGTLPVATVCDPFTDESLGELRIQLRRACHAEGSRPRPAVGGGGEPRHATVGTPDQAQTGGGGHVKDRAVHVPEGNHLGKGRPITGAERQTIAKDLVQRYSGGETIRTLASATGRSYGFVHRVLTESGVTLRRRGRTARRRRPVRETRSRASGTSAAQATVRRIPETPLIFDMIDVF
jgi:CRISPR-associated endoribonuclease Cas6